MASSEKPSHSWWWDSHVSPNTSKWLPENVKAMDERVKQMLNLIETDGDSFAKKAEIYYQKRPQLLSMVEDFYRMYRSLAERYSHLTGELRKSVTSFSDLPESGANSPENEEKEARIRDLEKELAESKNRVGELEGVVGAQKNRIEILEARLKEDREIDRKIEGNVEGLKIVALDRLSKDEDSEGQFLNRNEKHVITRNRVSVKC